MDDLDMYLTNPGCSEFAILTTCQLMGTADGFVNPERVTRTVTSGETFKSQSANYSVAIRIE